MSDINNVVITGRLTRDPFANEKVTCFTLAVNRSYQTNGEYEADFPQVVTFQKLAEHCSKYLKKGSRVGVVGSIRTRSYLDENNKKVYKTELVAKEVKFLDPAPRDNNSSNNIDNYSGNEQNQDFSDVGYFSDAEPYNSRFPWED